MLEIKNLYFSYDGVPVLTDVSFCMSAGENLAVIGESGCGKSTLLKLIYGVYDANSGSINYNGMPVSGPSSSLIPGADYVRYLPQDFGLMPYITAGENVGKFLSNTNRSKKNGRIAELLDVVGMADYINVKPQYLSGGQQQRIALAMVLAPEPELLLLDEPFSQIDAFRANTLRRNLFGFFAENKISCIVATHNSADFLPFSNKILSLKDGRPTVFGETKSVYDNPPDYYTASLFGDVNEIPADWLSAGRGSVLVYPHNVFETDNGIAAIVTDCYFNGSNFLVRASVKQTPVVYLSQFPRSNGEQVTIGFKANR